MNDFLIKAGLYIVASIIGTLLLYKLMIFLLFSFDSTILLGEMFPHDADGYYLTLLIAGFVLYVWGAWDDLQTFLCGTGIIFTIAGLSVLYTVIRYDEVESTKTGYIIVRDGEEVRVLNKWMSDVNDMVFEDYITCRPANWDYEKFHYVAILTKGGAHFVMTDDNELLRVDQIRYSDENLELKHDEISPYDNFKEMAHNKIEAVYCYILTTRDAAGNIYTFFNKNGVCPCSARNFAIFMDTYDTFPLGCREDNGKWNYYYMNALTETPRDDFDQDDYKYLDVCISNFMRSTRDDLVIAPTHFKQQD